MSTAMKLAFDNAGYTGESDLAFAKALQIADEAWRKWSSQSAGGARRDYVKGMLRREMTWAMLERCQPQALALGITWLLNEAEQRIRSQRPIDAGHKPAGGGHLKADTQEPVAPANPSRDAGQPAGDGHRDPDAQVPHAVTPSSPDHPPPKSVDGSAAAIAIATPMVEPPPAPPRDRTAERVAASVVVAVSLCHLDTVKIDGKPIGDCLVSEVRVWAERRKDDARQAGRDARFALSLVANLPGGEIVRKWVRPDEADKQYARAEQDNAA